MSKDPSYYKASSPCSLMLFGEHAVLHGQPAIACAIDARITVTLTPTVSPAIIIQAPDMGILYEGSLTELPPHPQLQFVLQAIHQHLPHLPSGFTLSIHSEASHTLGLGTSAAVTAAVHRVLFDWRGLEPALDALFAAGLMTIRHVQGTGSGTDLAASLKGGVVFYSPTTAYIEQIAATLPLTVIYQGYKTPTRHVIAKVNEWTNTMPQLAKQCFELMGAVTLSAKVAIMRHNLTECGRYMDFFAGLQNTLGVSTPLTEELLYSLRHHPRIWGAKISGSGCGDCIIGLGIVAPGYFPEHPGQATKGVRQLEIAVTSQGTYSEPC